MVWVSPVRPVFSDVFVSADDPAGTEPPRVLLGPSSSGPLWKSRTGPEGPPQPSSSSRRRHSVPLPTSTECPPAERARDHGPTGVPTVRSPDPQCKVVVLETRRVHSSLYERP